MFHAALEISNDVARMTLSGALNAASTATFREQIDRVSQAQVKHLVLMMHDLDHMTSAGVREVLLSKQKMEPLCGLYLVGVHDLIVGTMRILGVDRKVMLLDGTEALQIDTY